MEICLSHGNQGKVPPLPGQAWKSPWWWKPRDCRIKTRSLLLKVLVHMEGPLWPTYWGAVAFLVTTCDRDQLLAWDGSAMCSFADGSNALLLYLVVSFIWPLLWNSVSFAFQLAVEPSTRLTASSTALTTQQNTILTWSVSGTLSAPLGTSCSCPSCKSLMWVCCLSPGESAGRQHC